MPGECVRRENVVEGVRGITVEVADEVIYVQGVPNMRECCGMHMQHAEHVQLQFECGAQGPCCDADLRYHGRRRRMFDH
jgi:hypothetical protein